MAYTTAQFHDTAPVGVAPREMLRAHLGALRTLLTTRPELLMVTAELDLRARRDDAVRRALEVHERGWREGLRAVLREGDWASGVDADAAAELVIATVKGVRLAPELAPAVFDQVLTLLTATATGTAERANADLGHQDGAR